jgi:hypothetical protein
MGIIYDIMSLSNDISAHIDISAGGKSTARFSRVRLRPSDFLVKVFS